MIVWQHTELLVWEQYYFVKVDIRPVIAQLVEHVTVESCRNQMVPGSIPGDRIFDYRQRIADTKAVKVMSWKAHCKSKMCAISDHRSHFGSRYTLCCCCQAGLFIHFYLNMNRGLLLWYRIWSEFRISEGRHSAVGSALASQPRVASSTPPCGCTFLLLAVKIDIHDMLPQSCRCFLKSVGRFWLAIFGAWHIVSLFVFCCSRMGRFWFEIFCLFVCHG